MLIVCKQCQAEYELDPPAVPFARDQDLVFRCSSCGTSIPIRTDPEAAQDPTSPEDVPAPSMPAAFVLRQDGKNYKVGDAAMLQRWIVERRVWADDEISESGGPFQRVGDLEAFQIFFQLVEDVERSASTDAATEVPTPAFVARTSSTKLFSRPSGGDLPEIGHPSPSPEPEAPSQTAPEPTPATAPESVPDFEPETEVASIPEDEPGPEPATEEAQFGEVIPDDAPADFSDSMLDEPTMDMELGQEDFFSEEETVIADRVLFQGDLDGFEGEDDLEWGQTRRKSMAMWWLIFFGGLGGAGYFTLDLISQPEQNATIAAEPAAAEAPPVAVDQEGDKQDTASPEPEPAGNPTDGTDASASADTKAEPPAPEPVAQAQKPDPPAANKTSAEKKKPTTPPRPNAAKEIDRGWAQIEGKNWKAARAHFNKALSVAPGSVDGRFGMAYVNEHQGRVAEAVSQYCRLAKTTTGEIRSEVNGRLRSLDKECP